MNFEGIRRIWASRFGKHRNLTETPAWQQSEKNVRGVWAGYLASLSMSFRRMTRGDQLALILKFSIASSMGLSVIALAFIYYFIPVQIRIFAVPLVVIASFFFGSKVLAKMMIARLEDHLNKE